MVSVAKSASYRMLRVCGAIALSPLLWCPFTHSAIAQTIETHQQEEADFPILFNTTFEPPGDGAPRDTVGAGSRDGQSCSADEPTVSAILPEQHFGLMHAERPAVYAHLPNTSAEYVALIVEDDAGTYYERAFLPIPESPKSNASSEIVGFTLPESAPPLTIGRNYRWRIVVVCGETVQPDDPVLSGWVQRAPLTARQQEELEVQSVTEQAQWYAQQGYWYELIALLGPAALSNFE